MTTATTAWAVELQDALGADGVHLDPDVTASYARDQAMLAEAGTPAAVVLPRSTDEVASVMRVASRLPLESDPPQITKVDSGAEPIVWINVASTKRNMLEITDYMERYLVDQFATLEGVANVRMNGARRYAIVIVFVSAAVLTPPDVISQFALAVPTLLLYEASIFSVRMVEKKRAEAEAARAAEG